MSHQQAGVPGKQSSWHITVYWEDKYHHTKHPPSPFLSPVLFSWAWYLMELNIPLVNLGQLSWVYPLQLSCTLPSSSLAGQEKQKSPWRCISTAQQQLKHWNILFILNQNTAPYQLLQIYIYIMSKTPLWELIFQHSEKIKLSQKLKSVIIESIFL